MISEKNQGKREEDSGQGAGVRGQGAEQSKIPKPNTQNPTSSIEAVSILVGGEAEGEILRLEPPVSFWGGVDPKTGELTNPNHPKYGTSIAGKIVVMTRGIGSSSGSSILLELLAIGKGPAGILMEEADAILSLGAVVAREMGYGEMPVWIIKSEDIIELPSHAKLFANGGLEKL